MIARAWVLTAWLALSGPMPTAAQEVTGGDAAAATSDADVTVVEPGIDTGAGAGAANGSDGNPAPTVRSFGDPACGLKTPVAIVSYTLEPGQNIPYAASEPLADVEPDSEAGARIFAARALGNCLACHVVTALAKREASGGREGTMRWGAQGTLGPSLDGVGERYTSGELRYILLDPAGAFSSPDTVMPPYYRTQGQVDVTDGCVDQPLLTAAEIEHLVSFLRTLKK